MIMKKQIILFCAMMMVVCCYAQDNRVWWGYFIDKEASGLPYNGNLGYSQACTIDAAIFIPANHAIVGGGSISAIRVWLDAASTDHPHTMTELSQLMPEKIDALLQQIGLTFEIEEQPFSVEEFKQNIMRYF